MRAHGTYVRYVQGPDVDDQPGKGCRCDDCRKANREYERDRARRIEPAYVIAGPARDHVLWLSEQGVGHKTIAAEARVSHGMLSKLLYGDKARGSGPSKRIRREASDRILAVMPSDGAAGSRVPAGPVWDNIARLLERGWTKSAIAKSIGQTGPGLQIGRQVVTRRNAAAIRALLDRPVPCRVDRHGNVTPERLVEPDELTPVEIGEAGRDTDRILLDFVELLEQRIDQTEWRQKAACRGRAPWMWFPARGDTETLARAVKVCRSCLVREACLEAHLDERDGVYGGLSAAERRQIRSDRFQEAS